MGQRAENTFRTSIKEGGIVRMGWKKTIKKGLKQLSLKKGNEQKPFIEMGENWSKSEAVPVAFMFGFNPWKREHSSKFFSEYRTAFVFGQGDLKRLQPFINKASQVVFIVWGFKEPEGLTAYAAKKGIKVLRVEDGFVRSVGLGAAHTFPLSIAVDSKTLYFNARQPSDLEELLNTYEVSAEMLQRARECRLQLIQQGVSKYNHTAQTDINKIYGEKKSKRILVIGQVEDDASIQYGLEAKMTNNDLVRAAAKEHPECEIIYKPHPDVLGGYRKAFSNPMDVTDVAKVVTEPLGIVDALQTIDHVYTMTSLVGFEALIRGIPVTCYGSPFYAGWGLTTDRQPNARRQRKRTIDELFAISYLVYPRYMNPDTGEHIGLEEAMKILIRQRAESMELEGDKKRQALAFSEAEQLYKQALNLVYQPGREQVYIELLNDARQYEKSLRLIEEKQRQNSLPDSLYCEKGIAYAGLGHYEAALSSLLKVEKKSKRQMLALIRLLWKIEGPSDRLLQATEETLKMLDVDFSKEDIMQFAAILNHCGHPYKAKRLLREKQIEPIEVPYLSLAVNFDFDQLNASTYSEKVVVNQLIQSEGQFQQLLTTQKKIGIVLEATSQEALHHFCQKFDTLIFVTKPTFPLVDRNRSFVIFSAIHPELHEQLNLSQVELLLCNEPGLIHRYPHGSDYMRTLIERGVKLESYPQGLYRELVNQLGRKPSDRELLLFWIVQQTGEKIAEEQILYSGNSEDKDMLKSYIVEGVLQ